MNCNICFHIEGFEVMSTTKLVSLCGKQFGKTYLLWKQLMQKGRISAN